MIAFRTPVADCFVFYISRSPNEEVQVSHQGFPYPSTDGVAGPRSTIAKNLFGRYCCRTGRFRPAHSHGTRRKTDHTECAGQRRARALNPGLKRRGKRCRMGKQFRSIDLPPFQGVRNSLAIETVTSGDAPSALHFIGGWRSYRRCLDSGVMLFSNVMKT